MKHNKRSWAVTLIVTDTDQAERNDPDHGFLSKADIIAEVSEGDYAAGITVHHVTAKLIRARQDIVPPKVKRPIRRIRG